MNVAKVGVAWFRETEYDEFRRLFVDGDGLPETYDEWLEKAHDLLDQLRSVGHSVVQAYLHIETFPEWCRTRGLNVDAKARTRFANEYAMRDDSQ